MREAVVAFLGLAGWYEQGRSGPNCTFTRSGGLRESELTATIRVDLRPVLEGTDNPVAAIWQRPSLNLNLPDDHVRHLFEGCVGCDGSTNGHPWDGDIASLRGSDTVGLEVYLAVLRAQGALVDNVLGEIESPGSFKWWVKTYCYAALSETGISLKEADRRAEEAATPGPLPFSRREGYRWREGASKKTQSR